jgi:hypothetical protein
MPRDKFRATIKAAMDENKRGWVIDGNYSQDLDDMMQREATDIICVCHPSLLSFADLRP